MTALLVPLLVAMVGVHMTATAMPRRTDRLHLMPYWLGDSPAAVRRAALMVIGSDGGRFIDINLQRCLDGVIAMHWGTPAKNGFYFIVRANGRGRRRLTYAEAHRPLREWKAVDLIRLRRTLRAGVRYETRVRPHTYEEMVRCCKRWRVIACFELKSPSFHDATVAAAMVAYAASVKATVYFMTLVTMVGWRGKVVAFHKAGGQIALLAHGAPRPADLVTYLPFIDRIWGRFAS
jgi:hypothetical protein